MQYVTTFCSFEGQDSNIAFIDDDSSCMDVTATCNCYNKLRLPLQDTIRVTAKKQLPLTGFAYGPFTHQDAEAAVQLKSLECFGPPNVGSITRDDCGAIKTLGKNQFQFELEYVATRGECYVEISFETYVQLKVTVSTTEVSRINAYISL